MNKNFSENEEKKKEENLNLINQRQEQYKGNSLPKIYIKNWVYINPSIYSFYFLLNGLSIILGTLCKLIYPIDRKDIGKKSILTGIPFLRNYFFLVPFSMNAIYFLWCLWNFNRKLYLKQKYEFDIFKYLRNIRCAFLFSNLAILAMFYALYNGVYKPVYRHYGFRLSGHMLASLLSGAMIIHLNFTLDPFLERRIDISFNKWFSYFNLFLYYHSIYTVFWSSWIFHRFGELVLSFLISSVWLVIIHVINVDCLMLNLFDWNSFKKRPVILCR